MYHQRLFHNLSFRYVRIQVSVSQCVCAVRSQPDRLCLTKSIVIVVVWNIVIWQFFY